MDSVKTNCTLDDARITNIKLAQPGMTASLASFKYIIVTTPIKFAIKNMKHNCKIRVKTKSIKHDIILKPN